MKKKTKGNKLTFDCHGLTYLEVDKKLSEWLLLNERNTPLYIITGQSDGMRRTVTDLLSESKMKWMIRYSNPGEVIVL